MADNLTPGIEGYEQFYANPGGAGQGIGMVGETKWDDWMRFFEPVPTALPTGLRPGTGPPDAVYGTTPSQEAVRGRARREQQEARKRLIDLATRAGVNIEDPAALSQVWQDAVTEARSAAVVEAGVDPFDILEGWAEDGAPDTLKREQTERRRREEFFAEDPPDPFTVTRTNETVNLTDPETSRALVVRMLREDLGRDPSDSEIRDFTASLNKYERDNPAITTTAERYAYDPNTSQMRIQHTDSSTEGGADPAAFAQNYAADEHDPERDAYTAGVEYAGVMERLTGSI